MPRATRWMLITDTHGDHEDAEAVNAALEFAKFWKPEVRVHGGDAFDLGWLRDGATSADRTADIHPDLEAGVHLLRRFKPTAYLLGNHEHRAYRHLRHAEGERRAAVRSVLDSIEGAAAGAKILPYDKRRGVHKLGDHVVIHGNTLGAGAVRQAALVYGNVLMGHLHRIERAAVARLQPVTGHSVGCLCSLDMGYTAADAGTLGWQHGFAYGWMKHGKTVVFQAQKMGKDWFLPTEFKSFRG